MLYIRNIAGYLKILTDKEVKDFVLIKFGEYFKPTRESFYSKLSEEKSLKTFWIVLEFLATVDEIYVE